MRVEFSTNPNNQVTADDSPGTSNCIIQIPTDWSGFVLSVDRRGEECEAGVKHHISKANVY